MNYQTNFYKAESNEKSDRGKARQGPGSAPGASDVKGQGGPLKEPSR